MLLRRPGAHLPSPHLHEQDALVIWIVVAHGVNVCGRAREMQRSIRTEKGGSCDGRAQRKQLAGSDAISKHNEMRRPRLVLRIQLQVLACSSPKSQLSCLLTTSVLTRLDAVGPAAGSGQLPLSNSQQIFPSTHYPLI